MTTARFTSMSTSKPGGAYARLTHSQQRLYFDLTLSDYPVQGRTYGHVVRQNLNGIARSCSIQISTQFWLYENKNKVMMKSGNLDIKFISETKHRKASKSVTFSHRKPSSPPPTQSVPYPPIIHPCEVIRYYIHTAYTANRGFS
jgi:hypothetical protein